MVVVVVVVRAMREEARAEGRTDVSAGRDTDREEEKHSNAKGGMEEGLKE